MSCQDPPHVVLPFIDIPHLRNVNNANNPQNSRNPEFWNSAKGILGFWNPKTKCARRADVYGAHAILDTYERMAVLFRSFLGHVMTCLVKSLPK